MTLTNDLIPLKFPQFQLRDSNLFFMISSRPHAKFDSQDIKLWNMIDSSVQIGQLLEIIPDTHERLQRFWSLGVCGFAPSQFPPNRRKILIIEPHMDDAILSVGGLMWGKRYQCEFDVMSVTGTSNFTSYCRVKNRDFFDVNTITNLRLAESETVMRILGGTHRVLDQYDAPLRRQPGNWSIEWHEKNRRSLSAFANGSASEQEVTSWATSIERALGTIDVKEIWIPMGLGTSTDHETTRNACLRVLMQRPELLKQVEIYFYQDVPYASQFPWHTEQIVQAFNSGGGSLERVCDDISEFIEEKIRLVSIFGSQFKLSYMGPRVKACAQTAIETEGGFGEVRFKVKRFPETLDEMAMYSGYKYINKTFCQLKKWYPRHCKAKRIRILCPMGVGKFNEYIQYLLEVFPNAILEIHMTSDSIDETKTAVSDRVQIRPVVGLKYAWIRRILSVAVSPSCPLVVLTHAKLEHLAPYIKVACFLANPLLATTMDHFVLALRNINNPPHATSLKGGVFNPI